MVLGRDVCYPHYMYLMLKKPLAESILTHPDIHGIYGRQKEYKLFLFMEDILLVLIDLHTPILNLHKELEAFCTLSGYKINSTKMEALPIHIPSSQLS